MDSRSTIALLERIRSIARSTVGEAERTALAEWLRGVPSTERVYPQGAVETDSLREATSRDERAALAQRVGTIDGRPLSLSDAVSPELTGIVTVERSRMLDTVSVPDRDGPAVSRRVPMHGPDRATATVTYRVTDPEDRSVDSARRLASAATSMRRADRLSREDWLAESRNRQACGPTQSWQFIAVSTEDGGYTAPSKAEVLALLARSGVTPARLARAGHPFATLAGGTPTITAPRRRHRRGKRGGRNRDAVRKG